MRLRGMFEQLKTGLDRLGTSADHVSANPAELPGWPSASAWPPKDFGLLREMLAVYKPQSVNTLLSPGETMSGPNYLWVGACAVETIIAAVAASKLTKVEHVLDMPCGHGRVLRHLRVLFPKATIDACDLDVAGVKFCAETFGAHPIYSKEDLTSVTFDGPYDLIWIGSLFTHTSYGITKSWLTFLSTLLSDRGLIVATFHGRVTPLAHKVFAHHPDPEGWNGIIEDWNKTGFGYRDYSAGYGHDFIQGSYGTSLAKPRIIVGLVEDIPETRLFMYQERGWAENHDVLAFGKPKWDEGHSSTAS